MLSLRIRTCCRETDLKQNEDAAKFTADEDAKLKALKAENTPWKQINEQIPGHGVTALKARFKEINSTDNAGNDNKDKPTEDKKNEQNDNQKKKQNQGQNANQQPKKDKQQQQQKQQQKASSDRKNGDEARFTMQEWITLQEDDMFSFGELQCLSELLMRDQHQTWDRVASAFFDKTGRRIYPHDIRDKFQAMMQME